LAAEAQATAARQAASEAEASASAAAQRMKDLEAEVARMRAETQAQTQALVALRAQIAQDQAQRQQQQPAQQGWLVPALFATTALFAALSLWLGLRSRREPESAPPPRGDVWWDKSDDSVPPAADPGEDSTYSPPTYQPSSRAPLKMPSAPAPLTVREGPPTDIGLDSLIAPPTVAAPVAVTIPPVAPRLDDSSRAVSVDEQIDLEQQADFFIALGHDESAIDLLMAHLRSTGGGTPLPFLKLLEIHRRRSDREAYERTRVRFNQRFNSVAPEWTSDPSAGRALEDYPLVVGRIQHVWANPLDAMAELEALLFRRGIGSEMFDLPAYQEVLFLYQLARDLHQADRPEEADNVDVLLPIGAAVEAAPEGTIVLRPEFNGGQAVSLDLDLTTKTGEIDTSTSSGAELQLEPGGPPSQTGDLPWPGDDPDDKPRRG
jgi:pilus assembly protein FimV